MATWKVSFEPRVDLSDSELLERLVRVEAFRQSIQLIPLPPSLREQVNDLNILRQIKGTTGIEGNALSEEQIRRVAGAAGDDSGRRRLTLAEQEVVNARDVQEFIRQDARRNPEGIITEDLIRHLHELNTKACHYPNNRAGHYRDAEVVAGEYRPPKHEDVPRLMEQFLRLINSRKIVEAYRPILRAVIAHFYLISIHPFGDGNGRTSRSLEAYILYHSGYNTRGFYSLANYFYRHRPEYIAELQDARFRYNGDLTHFVKFALAGFVEELQEVQTLVLSFVRDIVFRDYLRQLAEQGKISARVRALVELLLSVGSMHVDIYRNRRHPIIEALYNDIKTTKTLARDLKAAEQFHLIRVRGEALEPNVEVLDELGC